jgi:hypothetical protein
MGSSATAPDAGSKKLVLWLRLALSYNQEPLNPEKD